MLQLSEEAWEKYLSDVRAAIGAALPLVAEKKINYGQQFVVKLAQAKLTLNIYNGKKGLSHVYNGDSALAEKTRALIRQLLPAHAITDAKKSYPSSRAPKACEHRASYAGGMRAGSDESGKGDFFGPLVVAAVILDDAGAAALLEAGVKDCKLLNDKKILALDGVIQKCALDCCVLEMKPAIYNYRYREVTEKGGNLNILLGYGHVAALSAVLTRHPDCPAALIDQFTPSPVNVRELQKKFPHCSVRQQPKAESELAVAAASVLARARFLRSMAMLAEQAGEAELPKGGGELATECARKLARKFGRQELGNYVKLHFANYERI